MHTLLIWYIKSQRQSITLEIVNINHKKRLLVLKFKYVTAGIRRHAEGGERAEVGRQDELQGVCDRHRHREGKQQAEHGVRRQPVQHLPRAQLRSGERNRRLVLVVGSGVIHIYVYN